MAKVLRVPFEFSAAGRAMTVEKDSQAEVEQCVEAVLRTVEGTRLELPEYGITDQTFRLGGPAAQPIREAIDTWEPRARYTAQADESDLDAMIGRVQVNMQPSGSAGP